MDWDTFSIYFKLVLWNWKIECPLFKINTWRSRASARSWFFLFQRSLIPRWSSASCRSLSFMSSALGSLARMWCPRPATLSNLKENVLTYCISNFVIPEIQKTMSEYLTIYKILEFLCFTFLNALSRVYLTPMVKVANEMHWKMKLKNSGIRIVILPNFS